MKLLTEGMKCEAEGCEQPATSIAYSRDRGEVVGCCEAHYYVVMDEGNPEYFDHCPNCGCGVPVN